MKKLYECFDGKAGFVYYQDDSGNYRFADNTADVALTAPIDPERVVWDDHAGWVYGDGSALPWEEKLCSPRYGMTKKKIVHLIVENNQNGVNGFWYAACGKWIMPAEVTETMPDGGRMCIQCQKMITKKAEV